MFNDRFGLTADVLKGKKTMTRRFLTQNYERVSCMNVNYEDHWYGELDGETYELLPTYKLGEIVAVAQAYKHIVDNHYFQEQCLANETDAVLTIFDAGWNNKMFVKSYYMPHHIRITDIKLERLQDISDKDCIREGLWRLAGTSLYHYDESITRKGRNLYHTPREAFAALIDKVSGEGTWDSDPWVFAYSFIIID
jgi:hypothetical protein